MDLSMPVLDGVAATRALLAEHPETQVLVLTSFSDRDRVRDALAAGAIGYLLKDARRRTSSPASAPRRRGLADRPARRADAADRRPRHRAAPAGPALSPRELEVLRLVSRGLANKQIGRALGISERTVKVHLGNVFRRIGVQDRTSAALWARENLPSTEGDEG